MISILIQIKLSEQLVPAVISKLEVGFNMRWWGEMNRNMDEGKRATNKLMASEKEKKPTAVSLHFSPSPSACFHLYLFHVHPSSPLRACATYCTSLLLPWLPGTVCYPRRPVLFHLLWFFGDSTHSPFIGVLTLIKEHEVAFADAITPAPKAETIWAQRTTR